MLIYTTLFYVMSKIEGNSVKVWLSLAKLNLATPTQHEEPLLLFLENSMLESKVELPEQLTNFHTLISYIMLL